MRNNYQTKKLEEVCEIEYGTRVVKSRNEPGQYNVYGGGGKTFSTNTYNRENRMIISRFGMSRHCVRFIKGKFFLNDSGLTIFPKDTQNLSRSYLDLFLFSIEEKIYNLGRGQAQRNLNIEGLKEIEIPLPPIEEQKKIVARLEKVLAKVKEMKRLRTEADIATRTLLSAELHKIFDKNNWKKQSIENIAQVGTGATPLKGRRDYYGGNIPWVTSKSTSAWFIDTPDGYITDIAIKETNCKIYPKHSLVVAMYGQGKTRGQVSELLIEASTNQACAVVVIDTMKAKVGFVKYFLKFNYENLRSLAEGGPQLNLSLGKIKRMQIPLPQLKEQKKIVERLDAFSEKLRTLKEYQQSVKKDLDRLEQSILHQAFLGE